MQKENVALLSRYNRTMNEQFYEACTQLTSEQLEDDRGAFFGSIFGTLNHLLLTDRLWLGAFTDNPLQFNSLDERLCATFIELRHEREATDAAIAEWAETLTDERLQQPATQQLQMPLWVAVTHFFNHQAHHRGQVSALLSQCGVDYGTTDLPWVPGVVQWS